MTALQVDLLRRIQDFRFDPPASTHTFADRLATENGWTRSFTGRAIAEYRRFAYLAMAAGRPVSPPEAVDQVWHLHLIYTRSYWDDFCSRTLGGALHHEPSTGGAAERTKFADWYARTLSSYRAHFGENPPADVWPDPATRKLAPEDFRRIDVTHHWIIPKARLGGAIAASLLAILLILLAAGCSNGRRHESPPKAWAKTYNPLDFTGSQFLTFYVAAFAVACVMAWRIRNGAREPDESPQPPRSLKLDPYAVAYLNGGPDLATGAAIAKLINAGLLKLDPGTSRLRATTAALPRDSFNALEGAVHGITRMSSALRIRDVCHAVRPILDRVAAPLRDYRLIPDAHRASSARAVSTLIALTVPTVGLMKIVVGIGRGRPIEFLLILFFATLSLGLIAFGRTIRRTHRGDRTLEGLRLTHGSLRSRRAALEGDALALGIGLFGAQLLDGTPQGAIARAINPNRYGGDSSGGSSCGGDGGGGGCGGGGCGGGCGGCGGGG